MDPGWGYTRLRGALKNLGYAVGRNTIKRILKEQVSSRHRCVGDSTPGRRSSRHMELPPSNQTT
jgi:hypothetical protein